MSGKRQNNQLWLAFGEEGRSEAPMASGEGSETLTAKRMIESPATNNEQLMEGKRAVSPSGIPVGLSLTMWSWLRQRERNVAFADFVRLQRSGGLSS
jgi:hypothetical protein